LLLKTKTLGLSALPQVFSRTLLRILALTFFRVSDLSLCTGHPRLPLLLDQALAGIPDALELVGIGLAEALDVLGHLADLLLVDSFDRDQGRLLDDDLDSGRALVQNVLRIAHDEFASVL